MNENEIVKPKRKKKVSEPGKTSVVKKTAQGKKAAPAAESAPNDLATGAAGEPKPAKKTAPGRKKSIGSISKTALSEQAPPPEMAEVAGSKIAEAVKVVEELTAARGVKKSPRKKAAAKKPIAPSSQTVVKKTASRRRKQTPAEIAPVTGEIEQPAQAEAVRKAKDPEQAAREESPIFKELAEPKLPALPQENRARLQMQSPNRIFFYWSVKHNPFETLNRALPRRAANYTLTIKLVNLDNRAEEIYPVEPSGSWWFDVDANTNYRAEVGFFAENRPFIRLLYSNTVQTPRLAPSPNTDWSTDFVVTAEQFAEVLDASGYAQDAFEVAVAGDDRQAAERATRETFFSLVGERDLAGRADELRSVLFALASKASLESLRELVSSTLYAQIEAIIRENAERLSAEKVLAALRENFEFEDETEEFLNPVFGASSINFPRKPRFPKFSPVSSQHSVTSR